MTQRLYDSRTGTLVDFAPRVAGQVGLYICGPTVQSSPHIGHLRSALVYDQMRRWFEYEGNEVTLVRNVTDIDDKILDNAASAQREGSSEQWWALAYRIEREFNAAYDALDIRPPTYEPRATANIQPMLDLIERLIERGHAYVAAGTANVYFDSASWPDYGELTRQKRDSMEPAADSDPRGKRDPRDFALWKAHKDAEPDSAAWGSPWGRGRPGWHIECSAMSTRYLGRDFDIHGGGLDLRFPHHENELAQSRAGGDSFARYWIHNGLVNVGGQKMSKSLGNSIFAADLLRAAQPAAVRYFLGSAHYRSTLEFHPDALVEATAALNRVEAFLRRCAREAAVETAARAGVRVPEAFSAAMRDDFALPQALAVLHETVRAGNAALDSGDTQRAADRHGEVWAIVNVLGINPLAEEWSATSDDGALAALGMLVDQLLVERQQARERRDFATSDRIRDTLGQAGISLEDTTNGSHWSLNG
ncbi:cysteine--tRNA ligase [Klugiella xanthotipulae]|uniref:Cysteine--tRNA ligase n=1 Tax=Klugiella xanthotipulae TaxID=244735 RepID=A0A543HYF0_9MICO|nr:cysteine--tRNA ligase [Klugiella xanthotipulae]TQM63353.1 cysteinyl-tRNA synthetase [Klugiella xanthotipulae]